MKHLTKKQIVGKYLDIREKPINWEFSIKPKSKKVCVYCGKEYKKDERCIGRVGGYYHELESKIKKVKKFSTDGEHFYINKQPVCEKEFLEQSKNIREIDKIKDIIKSNKLQYPNPFGKYIQVKRYNEILLPKIENELIEMLLATQPQPIKEEWNKNVETCSNCGIQWKKIGKQCPVCYEPAEEHTCSNCINQGNEGDDICCYCGENRSNFVKQEEPKQQSKDIEKLEFSTKFVDMYPVSFMEQLWKKQCEVIDTINSLTKRNIK